MLVESSVVAPFVLIYLLFFSKETLLDYSLLENVLLLASGIVTAIPFVAVCRSGKTCAVEYHWVYPVHQSHNSTGNSRVRFSRKGRQWRS